MIEVRDQEKIKQYLEYYNEKQEEIEAYNKAIKIMEKTRCAKMEELNKYGANIEIPIVLEDLINEIAIQTETSKEDIHTKVNLVNIEIGKFENKHEFINLLKNKPLFLVIKIYDKNKTFEFNLENITYNLDEIQNDGKRFKDKCSLVNITSSYDKNKIYTKLELNDNPKQIICHLKLNEIMRINKKNNIWLEKIILNCLAKNRQKTKH